jgi:hypothetical protein
MENAIRGIRNSWESHEKSDSRFNSVGVLVDGELLELERTFVLGEEDKKLALNLNKAGASHAKYLRQIFVSVDITAPLYWWKEMDQHKIAVVTNSESTMHTIQRKSFLIEDWFPNTDLFSLEDGFLSEDDSNFSLHVRTKEMFRTLEDLRSKFIETKDKRYWRLLIQLLPSGWNQMRTTTMNYATLAGIYHDRKNHRLTEWQEMCKWIESLPYAVLITGKEPEGEQNNDI